MTARYRARAKIRVTLTLIPSLVTCVIAVRPSGVAGIFTNMLSRFTADRRARAMSAVAAASRASRGSTSMETRPSLAALCWYTGERTSQAARTSSVVTVKMAVSVLAPSSAR